MGMRFIWSSSCVKVSPTCIFTFQNVLSSGASMVCCTSALKADFRSRQYGQWLLNTHCWYTAVMPHGGKLYQLTTSKNINVIWKIPFTWRSIFKLSMYQQWIMAQEQSELLQNVCVLKESVDIMKTWSISAKMVRYRHMKKGVWSWNLRNFSHSSQSSQDPMKTTP